MNHTIRRLQQRSKESKDTAQATLFIPPFWDFHRKARGLDPWQPGLCRAFQTMVTISQFNAARVWPVRRIVGSHSDTGEHTRKASFSARNLTMRLPGPHGRKLVYTTGYFKLFLHSHFFSSSKLLESLSPSATLCQTPHHLTFNAVRLWPA